ncbi:MAG: saccharopine dehydrogenase NADP-binding domain-containing protein [Thermoleophilia bacterium]
MGEEHSQPRVVVFGATGYTGRMTAAALVQRGVRPLLAGRDENALRAMADELGGLEWARADASSPDALRALLTPESVLLALTGPFTRFGTAAAEAAIDAGCTYIDSTGEAGFIRQVFEDYGPRAAAAGCAMITACGYDYVLGNLAAALALQGAPAASAVDVAYFHTGGLRAFSSGTHASIVEAVLGPHFAWRDGAIVSERGAARMARFAADGGRKPALSVGSTEHFALPRTFPELRNVRVYLGWFGALTRPMSLGSPMLQIPGAAPAVRAALRLVVRGSRGGPSAQRLAAARSIIVAVARDDTGRSLAEARLEGVNGYDFTSAFLAFAAERALEGVHGTGALGPIEAFGLDAVRDGCAQAGVAQVA